MSHSRWVLLAVFYSVSSLGGVSFHQKKLKVLSLMKHKSQAPMVAFEAYERELEYERKGLSIEMRAVQETNLLADKVRKQVIKAFEAAYKNHQNVDEAKLEVRSAIEKDIALAAPALQDEIRELALSTLESIDSGATSQDVELEGVEKLMKQQVLERATFFNGPQTPGGDPDPFLPKASSSKDAERKSYDKKAELIESLTSERDSARWVSTSNQTVRTAQVLTTEGKVSLTLKMEFLGATIEAGPSITFKRQYGTNATIMAEGLHPVILRNGNFDIWKRDAHGSIVQKNGKSQKRYIAFTCDAELDFHTDYAGSGGFSYMGIGAGASVSKTYTSSVNLASRRLVLPELVGGKEVTVKYISELCHNDFLKARINNSTTVEKSLDTEMRNVISGLRFSHARTNCVQDSSCNNWWSKEVTSLQRQNNVARCVEDPREKFRFCQLRGKVGQKCLIYSGSGKLLSSGENEYHCDSGLKCVQKDDADFVLSFKIESARGTCQRM